MVFRQTEQSTLLRIVQTVRNISIALTHTAFEQKRFLKDNRNHKQI